MRIAIARSGGFTAIAKRTAIDTASLATEERERIESLARAAEREAPGDAMTPDAFTYTIDIDGRRTTVRDARGAWGKLIAAIEGLELRG